MDKFDSALAARPAGMVEAEWKARLELAACYRLFAHLGWTELIFNHITVRAPEDGSGERRYLINPFGLHYTEVTASNLVKVGLDGAPVHATPYSVNRAGFVIHSAIHAKLPDAHCIMHVHTTAGMAVACKEAGLGTDNFYSAQLAGDVAYHDYEGVTTRTDEQAALVRSLGNKHCLILRNHGLLAWEENLPNAFFLMFTLNRACEIQLAAASMPGPNRAVTPQAIADSSHRTHRSVDPQGGLQQKVFDAMVRRAGIVSYDELV
jgi:ribulose-5-phosphate 4-epimerase/fuculose-1-phosphate aldolase